jgi:hypothetical protein
MQYVVHYFNLFYDLQIDIQVRVVIYCTSVEGINRNGKIFYLDEQRSIAKWADLASRIAMVMRLI